jgi:hypothetical protein
MSDLTGAFAASFASGFNPVIITINFWMFLIAIMMRMRNGTSNISARAGAPIYVMLRRILLSSFPFSSESLSNEKGKSGF